MHYAAYGSNLHPARLALRTASANLIGVACLPNWSLRFHKRSQDESGKCSISEGDHGVHFAIFEMSAEDKLVLDRIEGVGNGYSRISLDMPGFDTCFTYIAQPTHIDDSLRPYDWYRELVLAGARYHKFPVRYVQKIEQIRARRDPDPKRRAQQWAVVRTIER